MIVYGWTWDAATLAAAVGPKWPAYLLGLGTLALALAFAAFDAWKGQR